MVYGYLRVSSKSQIENNSFEEQEKKILERYSDAVIKKEQFTAATTDRPVFNEILNCLKSGDVLVTTKLDRFCRNTKEGLVIIDELLPKNISIHILNMGLIDNTPMGRLIVTNLLAFAEFERAMIVERTQSGKAIAKTKKGYREGRKKKYTKIQLDHAIELLKEYSYNKVAEKTGISKSTIVREVRNRKLVNN